MRKILLALAILVLFLSADTLTFRSKAVIWDTFSGPDTITHFYEMAIDEITGDFTFTYFMSDSLVIKISETNDPALGWYNTFNLDSTDTGPDSATAYNDTINPVAWLKVDCISYGDDSSYVRLVWRGKRE